MSGTVYKLNKSIKFGSEEIFEIKLDDPVAKHLRGINIHNMQMDDFLVLISNLSNMPPSQVDLIKWGDLFKIIEMVTGFLEDSQAIGDVPSVSSESGLVSE